ncbi:DoxX family protein [Sutcliffiella sp. NPDC057660]|uniref:DoxX family protein n=1 Tax=Sutcliffiella sp. NPDC057660 TaxID=3346199 RepID=UPI0036AE402F
MINRLEASTFMLRVVLGISFFVHGLDKFQGGIGNVAGWFDSIGLPGGFAYVVALVELVGGLALVLGLGTRIVAAFISLLMVGAIVKVKLAAGFLNGYELDLAFLAIAVFLAINGSKMLAVDQLISNWKENRSENNRAV